MPKKLTPVPKNFLRRLYLEEKLSSYQIAQKLNCSQSFIMKKLKEYKVPTRSIQDAKALTKPRYKRKNFNGSLGQKAYLIGFRIGDLYINQTHKNSPTLRIGTNSTKTAQIELVEKLFKPYGHIWKSRPYFLKSKTTTRIQKAVHIRCFVNRSFDFLKDKKDEIVPWILKSKKYFAAFLAGYIDAEGSFCICGGDGVAYVGSQDKNIIHQIQKKLIELGILCRPPQIKRKKGTRDIRGTISNEDVWGVWIHRKNAILKLINLINPYLKHADKRRRMKILMNNILERDKKYNRHQRSKWDKLYLKEDINYVRAFTF